ncbi:MAG: AraC family transcriptional regulator [Prevotellaceae bacterium]|nr:AraC family transcriptional regulator [Prevotellaceae bacterium]
MQDSKYLVANERDAQWGLVVNTVGYDDVPPNEPYPTKGHGDGYYFDTAKGRVLDEYQMLYLVEGEGIFSSEHVKDVHIKSGDIFLLFPGEWHTYYPVPGKPWKSYWIGFKGRNIDDRLRYNFFSYDKPVYHVGFSSDVVYLYNWAIKVAKEEPAYSQQILAGVVNNLIGQMYALERNIEFNRRGGYVDMINKARFRIREGVETKITVQEIAADLGSSYSNFRKLFKEYTGLSPALYQQELRLQRAKELLTTTDMSIKEIAYRLNFDSPDYFSSKFKVKVGCKPSEFRVKSKDR